jgi:hypothetical protein
MRAIPMQFHNADMQIRDEPTVMQSVRARAKYTSEGEVCKTLKMVSVSPKPEADTDRLSNGRSSLGGRTSRSGKASCLGRMPNPALCPRPLQPCYRIGYAWKSPSCRCQIL